MAEHPNEALAQKIMESMSEDDWTALNAIGEELAGEEKNAKANAKAGNLAEQEKAEDSTEEKETSQKTEEEKDSSSAEAYISFKSKEEFQKAIDSRLKDRLEREERKRKDAADKARREAEEKAAEQNQEFETLAKSRAERIAALEAELEAKQGLEEKNQAYASTLEAHAASRMEALNLKAGIKTLLSQMDVKERLDWLNENEADFALDSTREAIPPSPVADPNGSTPEADEAARREAALQTIRTF